jgi:hypothetical protein
MATMQIQNDLTVEENRVGKLQLENTEAQLSILQREFANSEENNELKQK